MLEYGIPERISMTPVMFAKRGRGGSLQQYYNKLFDVTVMVCKETSLSATTEAWTAGWVEGEFSSWGDLKEAMRGTRRAEAQV